VFGKSVTGSDIFFMVLALALVVFIIVGVSKSVRRKEGDEEEQHYRASDAL
jgi:hypothetical protein